MVVDVEKFFDRVHHDVLMGRLAQRGLACVRDADDGTVYGRSCRDVRETLKRLYGQLRLRINDAKSAVARPQDRTFLGYSVGYAKGGAVKRRGAPKALGAMKERVRRITTRNGGRSIPSVWAERRSSLTGGGTTSGWLRRRRCSVPWTNGCAIGCG